VVFLVAGCSAPAHPAAGSAPSASASPSAASPSPTASSPSPTPSAPPKPPLPPAGNPNGHAVVPTDAKPVDTSHPNHVVGTGTAASCTSAAVVAAVAAGGVITFSCGPDPVTITM